MINFPTRKVFYQFLWSRTMWPSILFHKMCEGTIKFSYVHFMYIIINPKEPSLRRLWVEMHSGTHRVDSDHLWLCKHYEHRGTDNLYLNPSTGMKQEADGKTGFIFVPQIPPLHVPSVLQNRYDEVINPIYCEWYVKLILWLYSHVYYALASKQVVRGYFLIHCYCSFQTNYLAKI